VFGGVEIGMFDAVVKTVGRRRVGFTIDKLTEML
jgi:hypothetical protein